MNKNISKKGFTIIEVVLVLAIAGLIFLMVFVALPNLQKNQRETERKNNYSAIVAALTTYLSNEQKMISNLSDLKPYLDNDLKDPQSSDSAYVNLTNVIVDATSQETYTVPKISLNSIIPNAFAEGEGEGEGGGGAITLTPDSPIRIVKGGSCEAGTAEGTAKGKKGSRSYALYGYSEVKVFCEDN